MKIKKIEIGHLSIPLKTPFKTALRTVTSVEDVIVRISTDSGLVGYGEAPPTAVITGDTIGSIKAAIETVIGPAIMGMEVDALDEVLEKIHGAMVNNASAKAAVDMAVYDLFGQCFKAPVYKLIGGYRKSLTTDITISVNDTEQMVKDSLSAVNRGFEILKVKVGKGSDEDMNRLRAIRDSVPKHIRFRVDANQGWQPKEAVKLIHRLEDEGFAIDLVEQPVVAGDIEGSQVRDRSCQHLDFSRRSRVFTKGCHPHHGNAGGGSDQHQAYEDWRFLQCAEDLRSSRDLRV